MLEVPKTNSVSQLTREGWWSNREVGRSLMGLLRDQEAIKGTDEDRQESMVSWKLTAEHFRRRVCPSVKAAEVQKMLPGIKTGGQSVFGDISKNSCSIVLGAHAKPQEVEVQ